MSAHNITQQQTVERKRDLNSLLQLFKYLLRYKGMAVTVVAVVLTANILALQVPQLTGNMIDIIVESMGIMDFPALYKNGLFIALVSLATWVLSALQNLLMLHIAQNVVYDLRHDVFTRMLKLPLSFFDNNTKGNIISIVATDIENISDTISTDLITLLTGTVTVVGSLIYMLRINPWMATIFIITVPLMFIVARIISRIARRLYRARKTEYGTLCGYSEEMITAQKAVKVYGIEEYNNEIFSQNANRFRITGAKADFCSSFMMPTMTFINNLNFLAICAVGAFLALRGMVSIGNISTFIMYSRKFAHPIIEAANIMNMFQVSLAACDRVFYILNHPVEPDDDARPEDDCPLPSEIKGELKFEDVSFEYVPGTPVLKNVSFTAQPGQKIAIVGSTGSGKTTIISLLLRFYRVVKGRVTIDGIDIKNIPLHRLRQYFALVLQDSWLFEGDIYENIGYAAKPGQATPEKIREMCKNINIDDFIQSMPQGYNSMLHTDSGGLSVGQKQLINIARTFMCDPPIFILDEATSSVDTRTEEKIKEVTDIVTKGKTSIIIAHRLSTILSADQILVMRDGEIIESGNHSQLLELGGVYKDLYESQFAEE